MKVGARTFPAFIGDVQEQLKVTGGFNDREWGPHVGSHAGSSNESELFRSEGRSLDVIITKTVSF